MHPTTAPNQLAIPPAGLARMPGTDEHAIGLRADLARLLALNVALDAAEAGQSGGKYDVAAHQAHRFAARRRSHDASPVVGLADLLAAIRAARPVTGQA